MFHCYVRLLTLCQWHICCLYNSQWRQNHLWLRPCTSRRGWREKKYWENRKPASVFQGQNQTLISIDFRFRIEIVTFLSLGSWWGNLGTFRGGCGGQVMRKGRNTLGTTVGHGGNCIMAENYELAVTFVRNKYLCTTSFPGVQTIWYTSVFLIVQSLQHHSDHTHTRQSV